MPAFALHIEITLNSKGNYFQKRIVLIWYLRFYCNFSIVIEIRYVLKKIFKYIDLETIKIGVTNQAINMHYMVI